MTPVARLRIAPGLSLDADEAIGWTYGLLGKKGSGKTTTARVMAEEMFAALVPVVVLDPMGHWWGLRSSADGKRAGLPFVIFGGKHGDVPLEPTAGAVMADLAADEQLSMILDLSEFGTHADERRFATAFLDRLYRRNRDLMHLFVDEADIFAPQQPQAGDRALLGTMQNIVRRGRGRGIGTTLITQRPAVLNKDVLTQVDALVTLRLTSPQDRAAIHEWVKYHGEPGEQERVSRTLDGLKTGEAWWWVPEHKVLERVQGRLPRTFDSSPTPRRGQRSREPKTFADVDLAALTGRVAETIERAKADDPRALRKELAALRRQLAATERNPTAAEPVVREVEVPVEVPVVKKADLNRAEKTVERLERATTQAADAARVLAEAIGRAGGPPPATPPPARTPHPPARPVASPREAPVPPPARSATVNGEVTLKLGARRMLAALAQLHPEPLTRVQVGTLADITPKSGTFSDYLSALKRAELIIEEHGRIALTPGGQEQTVDTLGSGAPTPTELQAMWGAKLKAGARRMLDALMEAHPDGLTRHALAERSEITAGSGTFSDYLSMLRRTTLAHESGGYVYAGDALFLGGQR